MIKPMFKPWLALLIGGLSLTAYAGDDYLVTKAVQEKLSPAQVIDQLKAGNARYVAHQDIQYPNRQIEQAAADQGQAPLAFIVSCVDARSTPEIVFNQPQSTLFVGRAAGNVVSPDLLGSIEFAAIHAGTKLIVVMGHTHCGAVAGACAGVNKPKNLDALLKKIQPAVEDIRAKTGDLDCSDEQALADIEKQNVIKQMAALKQSSPPLAELISSGKVKMVGAMHDLGTGKVTFFDNNA